MSTLEGQQICFFSTPGNAGDALINAGTLAAFNRAGVRWESVQPGDHVQGRTLLIGGGGNLTPNYNHVELAMATFVESNPRKIVILPHGIRGQERVLKLLRSQDLVVCRDRIGFEHCRTSTHAEVALAHDMAFHLDVRKFLEGEVLAVVARPFLVERLAACGWKLSQFNERRTMFFMRTDGECVTGSAPTDIDISDQLIDGDVNRLSAISAWGLLECVRRSRQIVTDRLHVAVAAALLGTPTELLPNSYDKNRSVFDHSLRRFRHIRFAESRVDAA
ncbi:MAG: polysaccharide pyruvyl transferase family protein [Actinobacteria bacterium]|nr:polysaccharide pyruvyl transferase family protein [Actinomycetota bacterium]